MMNKLKFLTKISLQRKTNNKWFLIANIIFAILIISLLNIDSIVSFFGGDFDKTQIIYVKDNTNKTYDILKMQNDNYKSIIKENENAFKLEKTSKTENEIIKKNNDAWYLTIDIDKNNYIKATLTTKDYVNTNDYTAISTILNNVKTYIAINESDIDQNELSKISKPLNIKRNILDKSKKAESENHQMLLSTIFPILILPFFTLTIFLIQMIGAEINDEKATRSMEIIISNVSPKTHLFSKVIASNLFVLLEAFLLVIYALIGFAIRNTYNKTSPLDITSAINSLLSSDIINNLTYIIPLALILMILTFIAYAILAGILASMTTNTEDFQQMQMPIVIISLVGYYLAMMANVFEGSIFIKILSFIPFISAILAPSLLILGQIGILEVIIAIILLIISIWALLKYGMRIYKVGILNYSSKNLWKKMFKALKG